MNDETVGVALLLLSLVCLGTWPALLRLCSVSAAGLRTINKNGIEAAYKKAKEKGLV